MRDTTLAQVHERFVINPRRVLLRERFEEFLRRFVSAQHFLMSISMAASSRTSRRPGTLT